MRPETTLFCQWNERAGNFVANIRINTWFYISCKKCWNFERDVASLPAHRWVQRLLSWHLLKARRVSRPRHMWDQKLGVHCRHADLGFWGKTLVAVEHCGTGIRKKFWFRSGFVVSLRPKGAAFGQAGSTGL